MAPRNEAKVRLAIVVSHPIQHFVPFYRRLAAHADLELCVFFMSNFSLRMFHDCEMGTEIGWNMGLLSGYQHKFLPEAAAITRATPLRLNNPSAAAELAKFAPQVILTYGYNQITQMRVLLWSRRNRTPVMMISDSELQQRRESWKQVGKRAILPWLFRQYACFLTVGDQNEAYLSSYGAAREKLFRSPFTIDEDVYLVARRKRSELRRQFRDERGIGADEFVVLTVGKLSHRKRPLDVIAAATRLLGANGPKVRFVLAGDGQLRQEIQSLITERRLPITFLGFVNLDRLPEVYCAADVLLHPAEADPHPLVMSEAACVGLPMVVSDRVGAVGPTDIVRAEENAIITPCGDAAAIASAVDRLAREPDTLKSMSQSSLRIFSCLDQKKSVDGLLAAMQFCLNAGRHFPSERLKSA